MSFINVLTICITVVVVVLIFTVGIIVFNKHDSDFILERMRLENQKTKDDKSSKD